MEFTEGDGPRRLCRAERKYLFLFMCLFFSHFVQLKMLFYLSCLLAHGLSDIKHLGCFLTKNVQNELKRITTEDIKMLCYGP